MKQSKKTIQILGIVIALTISSSYASSIHRVTPKNILAMKGNVGKVTVIEDISRDCPNNSFKVDFSENYGKMMWQNILTFSVSKQFKAMRLYTEKKEGICWANKIEIVLP